MLEPYDGKLSRTVLRREGGGNTADPADYAAAEDLRHRADGAAQCGLYAGGGDRWARERGTAEEMREGA